MKKHWNKILALVMGVLMLLAILPVGIGTAYAVEEDNEIVIPDYDPNNHNHMHDHDHEHDHEHEHEHEHAHDHEHEHEHEDLNAHRNPHEAARKNEQNPNLQTQQNAHKYPDKVEDPNAHRNPHENKQPEQDQKRQPAEHKLHAVGEPFVLTDGITLMPNSEDGDGECPHTGTTSYGNYLGDTYTYEAEGNNYHYVYAYEVYEIVCDDCGEVIGSAQEYMGEWSESHTYENNACTLCGHVNTCTHNGEVYESWYWDTTDVDPTYAEIPGDDHYHNVTGMIVHYTYCDDCGEHLSEEAPTLETVQQNHSYGYDVWNEDEETWEYVSGVCADCGHICLHTNAYEDWYWVGETHYEEIEGDHRYHKKIGNVVTYMYCPDCGTSFDESEPTPRTETYSHDYDIYESPLECYRCHHRRDVDGGPASVGDNTFIIANPNEVVLRSFTPETTGTYVFYSRTTQAPYGFIFDSDLALYAIGCSSEENGWDFRIECELTAGETYWLGACYSYGWEDYTDWIETKLVDLDHCLHENKSTRLEWVDSAYEEIDNNYHYEIGTAVEYTYCADCGALLDTSEPMQRKEQYWHSYSNGKCEDCGHVCTHTDMNTWSEWEECNCTEIEGDNKYHYATGTMVDVTVCEDCWTLLDRSEPYEYSGEDSHSYSNGKCEDCGHVCSHTDMNTWSEWEERNCTEIEGDNKYHNVTGTKVDVTYCDDCGEQLYRSEPYEASEKEWHDYDSDGKCVDCGHVNTCTHSNTYEDWYWYDYNARTVEEIPGDNRYHNTVGYIVTYMRCDDCGCIFDYTEPELKTVQESHTYDSDGKCRQCGHINTCTHENTYSYSYWSGEAHYEEIEGDNRYHNVTGTMVDVTVCDDCRERLYRSEPYEASEKEWHDYDSDGKCRECGHINTCTHSNTYEDWYWVGVTHYEEIEGDNRYHTATGTKVDVTCCDDCGEELYRSEPYEASEKEWHAYNSDGKCRLCGHQNTCEHENTYSYSSWQNGTFTEIEGDDRYHDATGTMVDYTLCEDCRMTIDRSEPYEVSGQFEHSYDNGVCWQCGHVCPHEDAYTYDEWVDVTYTEIEGNNKYHYAEGLKQELTRCSCCYKVLEQGEPFEVSGEEYHEYNSKTKTCYFCGHVNTCEHKNRTEDGWWYEMPKYEDWGSKQHMARGKAVFYSYCADCEAWYTAIYDHDPNEHSQKYDHEYDENGVCTYCGRKNLSFKTQPKSQTVANGKTAKFSVASKESGAKYQWYYSKDNGVKWTKMKGNTGTSISVKASATTNGYLYRCIVTANGGKASSEVVKLTVSGVKPKITQQPKKMTVNCGNNAKFSVVAAGSGLSYQWYYSKDNGAKWTKWSGKTKATLTVTSTAKNNGTLYRCVVKNSKGSVTSSAVMMTVDSVKPRILTQPKAATVASGKTATFKVVAAGVGLKYQWYYSKDNGATWKKYSGKTSATLKVKGSATTNGYLYRCKITNDTGSVTSKAVKLTVSNVKPKIIVQPAAASVKSGKTAKFTVVAAGVGLKYQWQYSKNAGKTWTNLSGKTSATFSVKVSKSNNGYLYRCVVKNTKGSVNSSAAKLTLKK